MGTVILKCPACGGYHQAQEHDCDEIICQGSSTLENKDKKKFYGMKDKACDELTDNPTCWNEIRWTTRVNERRDATVLNAPIQKIKGILYTNRENRW